MTGIIEARRFQRGKTIPKGAAWLVRDEDKLARGAAQVALGQWRHVENILRGSEWSNPPIDYSAAGAIGLLALPPDAPDWKRWHRDGWLFQTVSWIAAVETGRGPTRPPHVAHADKGFDGMQLLLSRDGSRVKRLLVFEDKATDNPRDKVRDEVWPALRALESGTRDHEIRSELAALLSQAPHLDEVQAVNRVMRTMGNRSYRVAVTVSPAQATPRGVSGLFKGYREAVQGRRHRRRAHVLELTDLRGWMDTLAAKAVTHIRELS